LPTELVVGKPAARDAAVTLAVDAGLGGAEDTWVCWRHGIAVGYGAGGMVVMDA